MEIPKTVLLSAISYKVTVAEEMVVFTEEEPIFTHTRFAFQRICNCWYLIPNEMERIMISHITRAHEYVCEWFGDSFEGKRGENRL